MSVSVPDGPHSGALTELAETVRYGLKHLGIEGPDIIVGPHLASTVSQDAVIYNTEQVGSPWFTEGYMSLLSSHMVWDYSAENIKRLAELGIKVQHVPIGYVPELERIEKGEEDIDVLFYGSLNERRVRVLNDLEASGLIVKRLFGVYGSERDRYIARSKVVLNMHFYDPGVFEMARVSYLLTNSKCVVSEGPMETGFLGACAWATAGDLVRACRRVLGDEEARRAQQRRGHMIFSRHLEDDYLKAVLEKSELELLKERYYHACTAGFKLRKPKTPHPFTVVVTVNDEALFDANTRGCPGLKGRPMVKVKGASSAADALERGKANVKTDWILFCHHDLWFPPGTGDEIEAIIEESDESVIGFAGIVNGEHAGFVIDRGWRFDHPVLGRPSSIEEFALLLRKPVRLDETLGWHLYGTDLCQRYECKLVRMPLFHNSVHGHTLPADYHESGKILTAKYPDRSLTTLNGRLS